MELTEPRPPHRSIATHCATLKDPQVVGRSDHDLLEILTLAILAVIGGAKGWEDLKHGAKDHATWWQTSLRVPNGIPPHDCYRRVFAALDPTAFAACFMAWMQALVGSTAGKLVAIDGKTMRRSFDRARGRAALHLVTAWVATKGVALGQVVTDAKSNASTAIPALLDLLDLRGAVVSIDAMGCQKEIAGTMIDGGADSLLSLKDNHPTAHQEIAAYFAQAINTPTVHSHATLQPRHDGCGRGGHLRARPRVGREHVALDAGRDLSGGRLSHP
jgi:predicted transposase YbfD/YdcC